MEEFRKSVYKISMFIRVVKTAIFSAIIFTVFSTAAVSQNVSLQSKKRSEDIELKAKRQIFSILLNNAATVLEGKTVYISTKNIPDEIQSEFSRSEKFPIALVAPEHSNSPDICAFEIGSVSIRKDKASVLFGDCKSGLLYSFRRTRGVWKIVPDQIINN